MRRLPDVSTFPNLGRRSSARVARDRLRDQAQVGGSPCIRTGSPATSGSSGSTPWSIRVSRGAGPRVATQPVVIPAESQADRLVRMAFRCRGRNGEQMIGVLDGTRDAPGACAWRLMSSSAGLLVRRQRWLQGCRSVRGSSGTPRRHEDGFLDAVDVLRVRHPVRIYRGGL
jgi:hypothetical protein